METTTSPTSPVRLESSWLRLLENEFDKPYMQNLKAFLEQRRKAGAIIYPKGSQIFAALDATPVSNVKVVILGQDPYHGPGQAHGLCFSVQKGVPAPPSLENIFKELATDVKIPRPNHGDLNAWAKQGVLLLNATLTVEQSKAGAHQGKGWEEFTDQVISKLAETRSNLVFILWGSYAQKKGMKIDRKRNLVIESPHPSPLSSYRGFFGSRPFSQTNSYLERTGQQPIDWSL